MASSLAINKGSDETSFQECDVCRHHNVSSKAVSYCISCQEFMCPTCDKAHRGSKLTRNHKLQSGSNMPAASTASTSIPAIMFCEDHKTMIVNMYCQSHDDVFCNTCKLSSHRLCYNTTYIKQQAQQMRTDGSFKETRKRLEDLKSKYDKMKISRNKDKMVVNSELVKCLQDMRQMRKDINKTLDKIEKTLSKEIKEIDERISKEVDDHVTIFVDALAQISDQLKSMEEFEKSQKAEVMFVGMKRASTILSSYEDTIIQIEEDLDQPEMTFKINDILYDVVKQLQSVDTALIDNSCASPINRSLRQDTRDGPLYGQHNVKSPVNMYLSDRRKLDVGAIGVTGCTFMPHGSLVLCCVDDGLILLDNNFNVTSQLYEYVRRVAVTNGNEVVVTGKVDEVHRVKLFPSMEVTKTMRTNKKCYGVDVSGGEIYVTCHDAPGNGEVQVLNIDGILQRRLGVNNGEYMFKRPDYVTINNDGSKVFVSDSLTNSVTCINKQGHVIYQYSDTDLRCPTGMYVGRQGNLLVCGYFSNNVQVIGQDGRKKKILLSETYPYCLAFRQSDNCLVVGRLDRTRESLIRLTAK